MSGDTSTKWVDLNPQQRVTVDRSGNVQIGTKLNDRLYAEAFIQAADWPTVRAFVDGPNAACVHVSPACACDENAERLELARGVWRKWVTSEDPATADRSARLWLEAALFGELGADDEPTTTRGSDAGDIREPEPRAVVDRGAGVVRAGAPLGEADTVGALRALAAWFLGDGARVGILPDQLIAAVYRISHVLECLGDQIIEQHETGESDTETGTRIEAGGSHD